MELINQVSTFLSDKAIFGFLETLKNEYSLVSAVLIFPTFRYFWNKYKKVTPWEEPKTILDGNAIFDGSEQLEIKEKKE